MCKTCKPIKAYQTVDSAQKLNAIKETAYHMVEEGVFTLLNDFSDDTSDYCEVQFLCEECNKVHILWLHTYMCRTGGEWREIAPVCKEKSVE